MIWILQQERYGLGNFVMTTPTIASLSKKHGRIPCFFETAAIRELYSHCPFIDILETKPNSEPLFSSVKPSRRRASESDAECLFRIYGQGGIMPPTYVDRILTKEINKEGKLAVALFHGCLGQYWKQKKTLPTKTLQNMVNLVKKKGYIPVILGNKSDWKNYWRPIDLSGCWNFVNQLSLKDSISVLSQCDAFISNDTGLYHVAAAYKVPGLVLWYQTDHVKNRSPWKGVKHCLSKTRDRKVYKAAIRKFLDSCE